MCCRQQPNHSREPLLVLPECQDEVGCAVQLFEGRWVRAIFVYVTKEFSLVNLKDRHRVKGGGSLVAHGICSGCCMAWMGGRL